MENYAKQAMNTEAERKATEIRLRAERRAGQLLRDMENAKGTKGQLNGKKPSDGCAMRPPENKNKTLSDMNISKNQSSKWQKLANVSNEEFEDALSDPRTKPSTTGIIKKSKWINNSECNNK